MKSPLKKQQLFWILFVSFFLHPYSTPLSIGCGGGEYPDITESLLFNPGIIGQEQLSPLFMTNRGYFETGDDYRSENSNAINNNEWSKRWNDVLTEKEVQWLIYKSSIEDLNRLEGGTPPSDEPRSEEMLSIYTKMKSVKTAKDDLTYLKAAKKAENFTLNYYYTWQENTTDTVEIEKFLKSILQEQISSKDPFLKGRYEYQLLKSWHYIGQYEKAISFYERNEAANKSYTTSIYWRNKGYYAACLYRMKRYAEANLIYADIYANYEPQRLDAYVSFHPLENKDWNELLTKANQRQKQTLWLMYGMYNDPVSGLEELLNLDPSNPETDLLLTRAINIAESNILNNPVYYWSEENYFEENPEIIRLSSMNSWKSVNKENLDKLISLIDQRLVKYKKGAAIWMSAKAFAYYLNQQNDKARNTLNESLLSSESNTIVQHQNNITSALVYISTLENISRESEEIIAEMIEIINKDNSAKKNPAERYLLRLAGNLYGKSGKNIQMALCYRNEEEFLRTKDHITALREFMERSDLNKLEQYLYQTFPLSISDIYEMEGTVHLYKNEWEKAISSFEKHPQAGVTQTFGDPFIIHIVDCHDCDHVMEKSNKYTKPEFAKKMKELVSQITQERNNEIKSRLCFEYANGLYNMTWYGNARVLSTTAITYSESSYDSPQGDQKTDAYYDCKPAQTWYETARKLTKDPEFAAKCAWMAAKCEHAEWLNYINNETAEDFKSGIYFNLIKSRYSTTKYYQEIINECGYFCQFNYGPVKACIKNNEE